MADAVIKAQFRLPPEQALALAVEDTPVYVAGGAVGLASLFLDKDKLVTAMRSNGALAWGDHHPSMFGGTERFFRPEYRAHLVPEWLPALEGVVPKLEAGAKVADVGCGHGASTVIMAQAFPASRFFGFDYHAPFIATAQQRAAEGGVTDRVTFAPRAFLSSAAVTGRAVATSDPSRQLPEGCSRKRREK